MSAHRHALLALAFVTALAACRGREHGGVYSSDFVRDTTPITLGPGDVLITNRDTSMDLALVGDRVVLKFSDKVAHQIRQDLDTSTADTSSRFGALIERTVKRGVGSMLQRRIEIPLADIDSASYDGSRIRLSYNGRRHPSLEGFRTDGKQPVMETFRPEDARRFVQAVNARKAAGHA